MLKTAFMAGAALLMMMTTAQAETHIVDQQGLEYIPAQLTIKAGDTVTFLNSDFMRHHIQYVSGPGIFESSLLPVGEKMSITLEKAGEYSVGCRIHPFMSLTITVEP